MLRVFVVAALFALPVAAQVTPKVDEKALALVIGEHLKDPDSLRLKNVRLHPTDQPSTWHLCGQYNAKNSDGGYVGFKYFVGSAMRQGKSPLEYVVREYGDFAESFCTSLK